MRASQHLQHLHRFASALSLTLAVAMCLLWLRSTYRYDVLELNHPLRHRIMGWVSSNGTLAYLYADGITIDARSGYSTGSASSSEYNFIISYWARSQDGGWG